MPYSLDISQELHERYTIVDIHAHPPLKTYLFKMKFKGSHSFWNWLFKTGGSWNPLFFRSDLQKIIDGKVDILFSSIFLPEKKMIDDCDILKFTGMFGKSFLGKGINNIINEKDRFKATVMILDHFEKEVRKSSKKVEIAKSYADIEKIINKGKKVIVHTLEGGHSLNGNIENLKELKRRGICSIILSHFYENEITHTVGGIPDDKKLLGCFKGAIIQEDGLKEFGREVVEEMLKLGIIIDLTHCTPKARREIYAINRNNGNKPLIFSHVGVEEYNNHPMNPTDVEIREIADTGGLIGVIFMNHWLTKEPSKKDIGIENIIKTIEHIIKISGVDCVGIGTDLDGFTDPPDDLKDLTKLYKVTHGLLNRNGITEIDVEKIMGGNAMRVLKDGWG